MPIEPRKESVRQPPARLKDVLSALISYAVVFLGTYWAIATWYEKPATQTTARTDMAASAANDVDATVNAGAPSNLSADKASALPRDDHGFAVTGSNRCRTRYPALAVRQHHEGKAVIKLLIGTDGSTERASVEKSSGFDELDEAALDAAKCMTFEPRLRDGNAAEGYAYLPFDFHLN